MRVRLVTIVTFGLLSVLGACSSSIEPNSPIKFGQELELREASTSINLDGQSVELTAIAWRDFMPAIPLGGPPLIVVVSLPDHLNDVSVDRLWILYGDEVWEPTVEPTLRANEWRASGSPPWEPGEAAVEVVAQVRDRSGNQFLVRDADVRVWATH
jgi:hypothetical protein